MKQFGFSLPETAQFGDYVNETLIAQTQISVNLLSQFYLKTVDITIFR